MIYSDGEVIIPNAKDVKENYKNRFRINIINALQEAVDKGQSSIEVKEHLPDWLIYEMKEAGYSIIEMSNTLTYTYRISFLF